MNTLDWLGDAALRSALLWVAATGAAIVVMCAALSPLVVLKRLSFVGQGVSHSAFGGIGIAAVLGLLGQSARIGEPWFWIVLVFCIGAAVGMGMLSDKRSLTADTAIGVFLAASMALGFVLLEVARRGSGGAGGGGGGVSLESLLFGQIMAAGPRDAAAAWVVAGLSLGVLWWVRRPLVFWAFDETASPAFGVGDRRMKLILMALLAVAIVTGMRLAGVVLVTALLVLPGAAALRLGARLRLVTGLSVGAGLLGLVVGLVASLEADLPTGACAVLALTVLFAAAWTVEWRRGRA